jgi:hypothetical protein
LNEWRNAGREEEERVWWRKNDAEEIKEVPTTGAAVTNCQLTAPIRGKKFKMKAIWLKLGWPEDMGTQGSCEFD